MPDINILVVDDEKEIADLIEIYYQTADGDTPTQYVVGDGNGGITKSLMRKIDVDNNAKDTYSSIIPPDPTDSSSLMWE